MICRIKYFSLTCLLILTVVAVPVRAAADKIPVTDDQVIDTLARHAPAALISGRIAFEKLCGRYEEDTFLTMLRDTGQLTGFGANIYLSAAYAEGLCLPQDDAKSAQYLKKALILVGPQFMQDLDRIRGYFFHTGKTGAGDFSPGLVSKGTAGDLYSAGETIPAANPCG